MEKTLKAIAWFEEVSKADIPIAGGKGANLGELTKAQVPVPPGFIVTSDAYFYFLKETNLTDQISKYLENLDVEDSKRLDEVASKIKDLISNAPMPANIAEEIKQSYKKMGEGMVAVRSSATAEDLPEASFAGQQRTFLNIHGENGVVEAVQGCWASLFEPRAIFYRVEQGFDHLSVGIAVPVQRMVQSEAAGVMFTLEPISNDQNQIVIEAAFGLGETVVSGELTPDLYAIQKDGLVIKERNIAQQEWELVKNPERVNGLDNNIKRPIPEADRNRQKLSDEEIIALSKIALNIENLYQFPQDIEWAKEDGKMYIVQTRPITTIKEYKEHLEDIEGVELLNGIPASPGMAAGGASIILDPSENDRVKKGDVLIAEMTTPDFVPAMKRAAAIATDRGGRTCHAAIVSRELGVPCIVGTGNATKVLKAGQLITVDGTKGKVYEGNVVREDANAANIVEETRKTKTKVYLNLANPDLAEKLAARNVDGIGLLRAEFMIADIGEHPRHMMAEGRGNQFRDQLAEGLHTFAKAFNPRPIVYRTTDFKTNEYRNLKGGEPYEELEENPMIGYRGCSRYIKELDLFKLEIDAIKKVRESYKNLWVMIPFVRTVKQMVQTKAILESEGLVPSDNFKLWMMVEVPSNIILMDKFIDTGINGISIGSNDLTQLTLGIDRDSPKLSEDFDERDEAVMLSLEKAIKTCAKRGITASICGQAPSVYPELTAKLVQWGITSISVNPDMIEKTRTIIADVEQELGISPE